MSRSTDAFVAQDERSQRLLVHKLPRARLVDRIPFVVDRARGTRVIHVGFADAGYRDFHMAEEQWLHDHLAGVAKELVGVDLDAAGVAEAVEQGHEAYVADCCDVDAVAALDLAPGQTVIAGEIIEHLDDPGSFLDAMHVLCAPDGVLVITTPNAYGWVNPAALLAGYEVNHPDHIAMYTWRTLSQMLGRHGWEVVETATFVPSVKPVAGGGLKLRVLGLAARLLLAIERLAARTIAPFAADGLIVVARPVSR
jgi:2-polyprenyl-3-methyl-5-hydroxy-6-metoxy-1,4-benzoquinol methylase